MKSVRRIIKGSATFILCFRCPPFPRPLLTVSEWESHPDRVPLSRVYSTLQYTCAPVSIAQYWEDVPIHWPQAEIFMNFSVIPCHVCFNKHLYSSWVNSRVCFRRILGCAVPLLFLLETDNWQLGISIFLNAQCHFTILSVSPCRDTPYWHLAWIYIFPGGIAEEQHIPNKNVRNWQTNDPSGGSAPTYSEVSKDTVYSPLLQETWSGLQLVANCIAQHATLWLAGHADCCSPPTAELCTRILWVLWDQMLVIQIFVFFL